MQENSEFQPQQQPQYILQPSEYYMQGPPSSTKNRQIVYRTPQPQQIYVQKHPSQPVLQQVYAPQQSAQKFIPINNSYNPNKVSQVISESGSRTITVQREVQVEKQVPIKKEVEAFDTVYENVPIVEEIPIVETIIQPVQVPAYKSIVYPLRQQPQPQPQPKPQFIEQPPKEIIKTEIVYKTEQVDNPEHLKKISQLEDRIRELEEEVDDNKKTKKQEQAKKARKQQEDQQQQQQLQDKVRELDEQFQRITMEKEFILKQLETTKNQNQDLYSNNLELNLALENLQIKLTEYEKNLSVKTIELSEEESKSRKLMEQYNDVLQHIVFLGIENERLHLIIREGTDENEKLRQSQKIVVKGVMPRQSNVLMHSQSSTQQQVRQSVAPQVISQSSINREEGYVQSGKSGADKFKSRVTVAPTGGVFSNPQFEQRYTVVHDQKQYQYLNQSQKPKQNDQQNKIVFENHQEKKQFKN